MDIVWIGGIILAIGLTTFFIVCWILLIMVLNKINGKLNTISYTHSTIKRELNDIANTYIIKEFLDTKDEDYEEAIRDILVTREKIGFISKDVTESVFNEENEGGK